MPTKIKEATTEVLTCLTFDSKARVNELVDKAVAAGGAEARNPHVLGFMYERSFDDLDGHIWDIMWIDPSGMKQA